MNNIAVKIKKDRREYLFPPEEQTCPHIYAAVGAALRTGVVACAVFGLILFIADAFRFDASGVKLFFIAFYFCAAVSLLTYSLKSAAAGAAMLGAAFVRISFFEGGPFAFLRSAVINIWNTVMHTLSFEGYGSLPSVSDDGVWIYGESVIDTASLGVAALVLSLIFVLSCVRCVRLFPMVLVGSLICMTVFTFNLTESNWGFAVIIAALCGVIVLNAYDKSFGMNGSMTRRRAYLGGFSAAAATLIAFAVIALPASLVTEKWKTIDSIDRPMSIARSVVSALISGDEPDVEQIGNILGISGASDAEAARSTLATPRSYTGAEMLTIRTGYNMPVYLRSWVGMSYRDDKWLGTDKADNNSFHDQFGGDFISEYLSYDFFDLLGDYCSLGTKRYADHSNIGFVTTEVDVSIKTLSGCLLYLPSRYGAPYGLRKYGGSGEFDGWEYFGDGMATAGVLNLDRSYRATAYLPVYSDPDMPAHLDAMITCHALFTSFMSRYFEIKYQTSPEHFLEDVREEIDEYYKELENIFPFDKLVDFIESDNNRQLELLDRYVNQPASYTSHVLSSYTEVQPSEQIDSAAASVLASVGYPEGTYFDAEEAYMYGYGYYGSASYKTFSDVFELVCAVADYLAENCTYTLNPSVTEDGTLSSIDDFLGGTKEGYCVQYATAGAMILRKCGLPVRYAEGYIADEFSVSDTGEYVSSVKDYNAHAWIEVYVYPIGWIPFEVTSEYTAGMYSAALPTPENPHSPKDTQDSSNDPVVLPETEKTPETEPDVPQVQPGKRIRVNFKAVTVSVIAVLAATGAVILTLRSSKAHKARKKLLQDAAGGRTAPDEAYVVCRTVFDAFAANGLAPGKGELPQSFALRAEAYIDGVSKTEKAPINATEAVKLIEKQEFGAGMNPEELAKLAEYIGYLDRISKQALNPVKHFWYRHIRLYL